MPLHVVLTPYAAQRGELMIRFTGVRDFILAKPKILRIAAWEVLTRLRPLADDRNEEVIEGSVERGGALRFRHG